MFSPCAVNSYYNAFAIIYSISLREAQNVMVNSSWTKNHVDYLLAKSPLAALQQSGMGLFLSALHHTDLYSSERPRGSHRLPAV